MGFSFKSEVIANIHSRCLQKKCFKIINYSPKQITAKNPATVTKNKLYPLSHEKQNTISIANKNILKIPKKPISLSRRQQQQHLAPRCTVPPLRHLVLQRFAPPQFPPQLLPLSSRHQPVFTIGAGATAAFGSYIIAPNSSLQGSSSTTAFDSSISTGYLHPVSRNCRMGIEVGVDFGVEGKKLNFQTISVSAQQSPTSQFTRGILAQLFRNISQNIDPSISLPYDHLTDAGNSAIHANVWHSFAGSMRYLGGNPDDLQQQILDFICASPHSNGIFTIQGTRVDPNAYATFSNFVTDAMPNISALGNGNIMDGMQQLRTFVTNNYPSLSYALTNLASQDVGVGGTSFANGNTDIPAATASEIALVFRGIIPAGGNINSILGLLEDAPQDLNICADINQLYNPTLDSAHPNVANLDSTIQTKVRFGLCPHVSFKIEYFIEEMAAAIYAKIGIMQLNGSLEIKDNTSNSLQKEKLKKITTFFAVGISREISDGFHINLELSHALKTKVHLDQTYSRPAVDVSKTNIKLAFTYHFRSCP
jgi:hypothetical protein